MILNYRRVFTTGHLQQVKGHASVPFQVPDGHSTIGLT